MFELKLDHSKLENRCLKRPDGDKKTDWRSEEKDSVGWSDRQEVDR